MAGLIGRYFLRAIRFFIRERDFRARNDGALRIGYCSLQAASILSVREPREGKRTPPQASPKTRAA